MENFNIHFFPVTNNNNPFFAYTGVERGNNLKLCCLHKQGQKIGCSRYKKCAGNSRRMQKIKNLIRGHDATDQPQKLRKDSDTEPCSQILSPTLTKGFSRLCARVDYIDQEFGL
jgi:hypothetical protein